MYNHVMKGRTMVASNIKTSNVGNHHDFRIIEFLVEDWDGCLVKEVVGELCQAGIDLHQAGCTNIHCECVADDLDGSPALQVVGTK